MADWDCKSKTLTLLDAYLQHIRVSGSKTYGITARLDDIGAGKAMLDIHFFVDWGAPDDYPVILSPGEYESYTDPDGTEWRVYVDAVNGGSADVRVCFEEAAPAEGKIMSIDVPASAKEGDSVDLCATIKNVGGVAAKFFLRFYDGATMVRETLPGNVAAGQTIEDVCELFAMPGHKWTGKIELMRQT